MAEYITKEAAIEVFEWGDADVIEAYGDGCDFGFSRGAIKSAINSIPAADVAPVVYGRWEQDADGDWYCTNCDEVVAICESGRERTYRKPYCPNCGAKMDGKVVDDADDHD